MAKLAGLLGVLAAVLGLSAAFLPLVLIHDEVAFRIVDFAEPTRRWIPGLAELGVESVLLAIAGLVIAFRGRSLMASGVLLGLGLVGLTTDLVSDLRSDPIFRPGSGLWVSLAANLLAVASAIVSLTLPRLNPQTMAEPNSRPTEAPSG